MNLRVNVIVPVYNVEKYICQCLDSILNQTYKNIKLIVIDDGSTDNSKKIIKDKYADKFDNVLLLEQENKGVSDARNLALSYIDGEYLLFVDPDDYLEKNMIETLVYTAKQRELDVVICGYRLVYDDTIQGIDRYISPIKNIKDKNIYTGKEAGKLLLEGELVGQLWNKLFRIKNINRLNMKFDSGRYSQDWYPVFVQLINASSVGFIDKSLYNYRQRGTSTVYKKSNKNISDYYYASNKIIEYIDINKVDIKKDTVNTFKAISNNTIISMYNQYNMKEGYKIYNKFTECGLSLFNISLAEIIKLKKLKISTKISLILWKMKMRHIAYKIKEILG